MVKTYLFLFSFFVLSPVWAAEHESAAKEETKKEEAPKEEKKKEPKEEKGPLNELKVEDMIIPVLLREDVQAYYAVSFTIRPKDDTKKEELTKYAPRIKDAVLSNLYVILPVIWNKDAMPTVELIQKKIASIAGKTAPEGTIGEVTIDAFQVTDAKRKGG